MQSNQNTNDMQSMTDKGETISGSENDLAKAALHESLGSSSNRNPLLSPSFRQTIATQTPHLDPRLGEYLASTSDLVLTPTQIKTHNGGYFNPQIHFQISSNSKLQPTLVNSHLVGYQAQKFPIKVNETQKDISINGGKNKTVIYNSSKPNSIETNKKSHDNCKHLNFGQQIQSSQSQVTHCKVKSQAFQNASTLDGNTRWNCTQLQNMNMAGNINFMGSYYPRTAKSSHANSRIKHHLLMQQQQTFLKQQQQQQNQQQFLGQNLVYQGGLQQSNILPTSNMPSPNQSCVVMATVSGECTPTIGNNQATNLAGDAGGLLIEGQQSQKNQRRTPTIMAPRLTLGQIPKPQHKFHVTQVDQNEKIETQGTALSMNLTVHNNTKTNIHQLSNQQHYPTQLNINQDIDKVYTPQSNMIQQTVRRKSQKGNSCLKVTNPVVNVQVKSNQQSFKRQRNLEIRASGGSMTKPMFTNASSTTANLPNRICLSDQNEEIVESPLELNNNAQNTNKGNLKPPFEVRFGQNSNVFMPDSLSSLAKATPYHLTKNGNMMTPQAVNRSQPKEFFNETHDEAVNNSILKMGVKIVQQKKEVNDSSSQVVLVDTITKNQGNHEVKQMPEPKVSQSGLTF